MRNRRQSNQSKASSSVPEDPRGDKRNGTNTSFKKNPPRSKQHAWLLSGTFVLAALAGFVHFKYVSNQHENHLRFSYLSNLERELTFRTEMGFYYSYCKQVVQAPSYLSGLYSVIRDNITEYPDEINALKRFNLYPEIVIAAIYRIYSWYATLLNIKTKECYSVNRGDSMPPILNCEGMGELPIFYVHCVMCLWGFMMFCLFFLGREVAGGSILGGILTVSCYAFNHPEATRVQWTPPLRESFSYPLFVLQQFVLVRVLRSCRKPFHCYKKMDNPENDEDDNTPPTLPQLFALVFSTLIFLLPWQFAQFALMTQAFSLMGTYMLEHISIRQFRLLIRAYMLSLALAYLLQLGNSMLLTSAYSYCLLAMLIVTKVDETLMKKNLVSTNGFIVRWCVQLGTLVCGFLFSKTVVSFVIEAEDDKHIWEILRSKFTNYASFHTKIYTCASEFDFLRIEDTWLALYTLLSPCAAIAFLFAVWRLAVCAYYRFVRKPKLHFSCSASGDQKFDEYVEGDVESEADKSYFGPEIPYLIVQLVAFTFMAWLIMRLKLFWTPQMCITAALLVRPNWPPFSWLKNIKYSRIIACFLLIGAMSIYGHNVIQKGINQSGEYSNWPMEQLLNWIEKNTSPNEAFAGPMGHMANIRLSTWRPICNHPHYENAALRYRTELATSIYSRKPVEEVWKIYRYELKATYVLLENNRCYVGNQGGCSNTELFDYHDLANRGKTPLCLIILNSPNLSILPYFKNVFTTDKEEITILKVWDGKA